MSIFVFQNGHAPNAPAAGGVGSNAKKEDQRPTTMMSTDPSKNNPSAAIHNIIRVSLSAQIYFRVQFLKNGKVETEQSWQRYNSEAIFGGEEKLGCNFSLGQEGID
jgi:hypothetical protein